MESWFQLPPSGSDRLGILREKKFINKDKNIKFSSALCIKIALRVIKLKKLTHIFHLLTFL